VTELQLQASMEVENEQETPELKFTCEPQSFVLPPSQKKWVRLNLRPLCVGNLRFIGCTWRLNNLVPARHMFAPRQNSDVQNEDTQDPLAVQVVAPMPVLKAVIQETPKIMLHGELRHLSVTLHNVGATKLIMHRVVVSHPAFFCIGEFQDEEVEETTPSSRPSVRRVSGGTKVDGDAVVVSLPDIEANQSITLPLWLRGASVGPQTIGMLFHYEAEGAVSHKMDYRLCRYFRDLQVIPSLKVHCRAVADTCKAHEYQMAVEVENLLPDANFTIQQVASASSKWALKLKSVVDTTAPPEVSALHKIAPGQRSTIGFTANQSGPEEVDADSQTEAGNSIIVSDICFGTSRVNSVATPMRHLMEAARGSSAPTGDMDIVVAWSMQGQGKTSCSGQHLVPSLPLVLPVEVGRTFQRSPIRVTIDSPVMIEHDFTQDMVCTIPIAVHITSCCETKDLGITFEAFAPDDEDVPNPQPGGTGPFTASHAWLGATKKTFRDPLAPGATVVVETSIAVWSPALYNLNRFRVRVVIPNTSMPLVYVPQAAHVVCVKSPGDE